MKRLLLIPLVLFSSLAFGQSNEVKKSTEHNISIGMFDDKTGLSLIGYTCNKNWMKWTNCFLAVAHL